MVIVSHFFLGLFSCFGSSPIKIFRLVALVTRSTDGGEGGREGGGGGGGGGGGREREQKVLLTISTRSVS